MIRQYIGARYVPLIFNNNGSNEWVNGIAYEPLTIVTYMNNSYTSVKSVPANAGNPSIATEYWANTGNIPGIITSLQNDVSALQTEEIENDRRFNERYTLNDRSFIIGGDSYTHPDYGDIAAKIGNYLGKTYIDACQNGSSFSGAATNLTWLNALQNATGSMTSDEKEQITDIIMIGGINDSYPISYFDSLIGETATEYTAWLYTVTKIQEFADYCLNNFPNAQISLAFCGNAIDGVDPYNRTYLNVARAMNAWQYVCGERHNLRWIPNVVYPMHNYLYMRNDGVHPTSDGGSVIAKMISDFMIGGIPSYDEGHNQAARFSKIIQGSNVDASITQAVVHGNTYARITDNLTSLFLGQWLEVTFNNNQTAKTLNSGDWVNILEYEYKEIGFGKGLISFPCKVISFNFDGGGGSAGTEIPACILVIERGIIKLRILFADLNTQTTSIQSTKLHIFVEPYTYNTLMN